MEMDISCLKDIFPESLLEQYKSALFIRNELTSGRLTGRTREAVGRWLEAHPDGKLAAYHLDTMRRFLDGFPLEKAENVFENKYVEFLRKPESRATLAWIISNKVDIKTEHEILRKTLRSFLSPTQSVYFPCDLSNSLSGGTDSAINS